VLRTAPPLCGFASYSRGIMEIRSRVRSHLAPLVAFISLSFASSDKLAFSIALIADRSRPRAKLSKGLERQFPWILSPFLSPCLSDNLITNRRAAANADHEISLLPRATPKRSFPRGGLAENGVAAATYIPIAMAIAITRDRVVAG